MLLRLAAGREGKVKFVSKTFPVGALAVVARQGRHKRKKAAEHCPTGKTLLHNQIIEFGRMTNVAYLSDKLHKYINTFGFFKIFKNVLPLA